MNYDIASHWFIVYSLFTTAFVVTTSLSSVMICKNTINNKSISIGLFTVVGIMISNGLSSMIGFSVCSFFARYNQLFKYIQLIGTSYLLYVGVKMMTSKIESDLFDRDYGLSYDKIDAIKNGFLYTFSDIYRTIIIVAIVSQFYKVASRWYEYLYLLSTIPIISFVVFSVLAFGCRFSRLWYVLKKYAESINKVIGFAIVILVATNIRNVLK